MTEEEIKYIAGQLRKPEGEHGIEVGENLTTSNATLYQHTLDVLEATAGDKILEIGMGSGAHVADILNKKDSIQYTACDYSQTMIDEAQRINEFYIKRNQAKFLCADVCALPFEDRLFTKAFTVNTIYFWDDVDLGISELSRVLQPGGQLIIAGRPKHIIKNYLFTKYGFRMFDKNELITLLSKHGYTNVSVTEKKEPPREMDGKLHAIETLIVSGILK